MRDAPSFVVFSNIAYRGDYSRVFWCAGTAQYATGRGCTHYGGCGQPGRIRKAEEGYKAAEARFSTRREIAASASGRTASAAGTGFGSCTGTSATTAGKAQTEAKTKTETQGKAKTGTKSCTEAAYSACRGGTKAETETREAR